MSAPSSDSWTDRLNLLFATVGGSGLLPIAPGTWGSLVAAIIFWLLPEMLPAMELAIIALLLLLGVWSSAVVEQRNGITDPGLIVIDELVGMWIGLLFLPKTFVLYLFAFLIFRIFDIVKIPPAKQLQNLHGGWGVMLDDVAAGLYTLILMQIGLAIL
ncbi:MAG: phosphatidylglycerophosphatase A [Candidatus Marinimicrobia bacterium]|nr:phosphatidylglycerophosphatase A [Candidatus Neomarinimicrobiota bacterium]MCF7828075.1 phosphatidylglycerophosphatase A [Candidatus Neomarinimicrobiota bacterium]MCF7879750.1 phosphatidylglycerophosphatase A [Candidatus Neomarinimicrobiota bacterium]